LLAARSLVFQQIVSGIDEPDLESAVQVADGHEPPSRPGNSWLGDCLAASGAYLPPVAVHHVGDMDGPQWVLGLVHQDNLRPPTPSGAGTGRGGVALAV
jgi:hypothetical protein